MKIIVTGGAGFIGSHVVDHYIKAGHRVVVVDNLKTGHRKNINPKARFYKADIGNSKAIEDIFKKERPEIVNHLAAHIEVSKSLRDPVPTIRTNTLGTVNLLIAFSKFGTGKNRKFIFSSTGGAMYGKTKKIPASEKVEPDPLSPYGLSKLLAEESVKFYAAMHKFSYLVFRYANVYGPRQNARGEAGVIAIFSHLMKQDKRPTIYGDGTKTRDYVFVDDVARANLLGISKGRNQIFNIGRGIEIQDQEVYAAVARATGFTGKPHYRATRKGEVVRSALNSEAARKILGWKPQTEFAKGVAETASYFSEK